MGVGQRRCRAAVAWQAAVQQPSLHRAPPSPSSVASWEKSAEVGVGDVAGVGCVDYNGPLNPAHPLKTAARSSCSLPLGRTTRNISKSLSAHRSSTPRYVRCTYEVAACNACRYNGGQLVGECMPSQHAFNIRLPVKHSTPLHHRRPTSVHPPAACRAWPGGHAPPAHMPWPASRADGEQTGQCLPRCFHPA